MNTILQHNIITTSITYQYKALTIQAQENQLQRTTTKQYLHLESQPAIPEF